MLLQIFTLFKNALKSVTWSDDKNVVLESMESRQCLSFFFTDLKGSKSGKDDSSDFEIKLSFQLNFELSNFRQYYLTSKLNIFELLPQKSSGTWYIVP